MPSGLSKICLVSATAGALLIPAIFAPRAGAQKQGAPLWYDVVTVKRVSKPNRQPAGPAPRKTQRAALLTLQWRVLKRSEDGKAEETDATKGFQTGDKVKLAITANQSGYLYIVNQPEGKDGVLLFPDLRINKGLNSVIKDREYVLPTFCEYDDPKDCWWQMVPPAGTETLIVIFSRDKITTLPNQIDKPYSAVKRSVVEALIATSDQKVKQQTGQLDPIPGQKAARFGTRAQNINLQDNEELIATIELTHGE
jgi:Domain of unknown function (DUF4384)